MKASFFTPFKNLFRYFPFVKSLRFRIFILVVLIGYLPTGVMRFGILQNYENRAVSLRTSEVESQVQVIANHLASNNYLEDPNQASINAELTQVSTLYDGRVLVIDESLKIVTDTYGLSEGKTIISEEVIKTFRGENISNYDDENHFIEFTTPITVTTEKEDETTGETVTETEIIGVLLTSVSTDNIETNIQVLNSKAQTLQVIMMLVIALLAFILSKTMVRPLEHVTDSIRAIKDGFDADEIPVGSYTEVQHISEAFNEVLARMKALDESRQEFVSNVSHELKTPITSMKVLADSLLAEDNVPVELYQEFMTDIAAEIDRESEIINDLLGLVRMDKKNVDLQVESLHMNELVETVLKRLSPIAHERDVDLIFESARDVVAEVDEVKMTLVLNNLIENGIKYNKEHGYVKLLLDADHQYMTITVEDNGLGIPEEDVPHIFERFYRVDKSHSARIDGTGLGLAITRSAVLMHRGAITVESVAGEGTMFTVKIPLTYVS